MAYQFGHPEVKQIGSEGQAPTFEGKRVFVTGASSGIGYGIAERALQRGAKEVWICSRNEERIKAAADKLNAEYGNRVTYKAVDVSDAEGLTAFVDEMAKGGNIDFAFANAGINVMRPFEQYQPEQFQNVMNINFYGVYNTDQAVIKYMIKQGSGYVCNVASMEGFIASGYHAAYCSSKFAVFGLTKALRYEYAPQGIKFSVICPGPVQSNIWGRDPQGNVNPNAKAPDGALTGLEAADEIFAGMEEDRDIIIITDTARMSWQKLHENPESADRWATKYTLRNFENMKKRG